MYIRILIYLCTRKRVHVLRDQTMFPGVVFPARKSMCSKNAYFRVYSTPMPCDVEFPRYSWELRELRSRGQGSLEHLASHPVPTRRCVGCTFRKWQGSRRRLTKPYAGHANGPCFVLKPSSGRPQVMRIEGYLPRERGTVTKHLSEGGT